MVASLPLSATIDGAEEQADMEVLEMEYLFEKFLLPSDMCGNTEWFGIPEEHVCKLGRIVKDQDGHYVVFFEDGVVPGKLWCFRYWGHNSIHGLTKGWGCFVREKSLKAGDTVSFFRGAACGRLFICCKSGAHASFSSVSIPSAQLYHSQLVDHKSGMLSRHVPSFGQARLRAGNEVGGRSGAQPPRLPSFHQHHTTLHRVPEPMTEMPPILESMFLVATPPAVKSFRLFGVDIYVLPLPSIGLPKQESVP